jgi:hypothetical protein
MNAKPSLPRRPVGTTVAAAVLSILIAIGLLTSVAAMFQHDGAPLEHVVIAERACSEYAFVSERESCMRSFLAASRVRNVASR